MENLTQNKPTRYQLKQAHARQIAIDWQWNFNHNSHSWQYCADWQARFERIGRKYGLIREFRENGIL